MPPREPPPPPPSKVRKKAPRAPLPARVSAWLREHPRATRGIVAGFGVLCAFGLFTAVARSYGWTPREPFMRNAPEVDEAMRDLDSGQAESAEQKLARYLDTGYCGADSGMHVSSLVRKRPNGTFDLGLTLFALGERFGRRFGEEELGDGGSNETQLHERRLREIRCALVLVEAIAADPDVPIDLRARAYYLAGNLHFLAGQYEDAVKEYDRALALIPGFAPDAALDAIGRDAAHNRALALRRIEDRKDAGQDSPPDAPPDAQPDAGEDAPDGDNGNDGSSGEDGGQGDSGQGDGGGDGGDGDGGAEAGPGDSGVPASPDAAPPQPATPDGGLRADQDERLLEELGEAPSYQEQEAKARANQRRSRSMEDK